ncbi:hypothetical protein D3C71_1645950 [compost metagenome]
MRANALPFHAASLRYKNTQPVSRKRWRAPASSNSFKCSGADSRIKPSSAFTVSLNTDGRAFNKKRVAQPRFLARYDAR